MTSSADVTSRAPSRMSALHPAENGASILPGTAMTGRPRSAAKEHVIMVPLLSGHSMARTPDESAATMRLRCGKVVLSGLRPNGNSVATAPPEAAMRRASSRFSSGKNSSSAPPRMPTVVPPAASAPECAAASAPCARPLTTDHPACARPAANLSAHSAP